MGALTGRWGPRRSTVHIVEVDPVYLESQYQNFCILAKDPLWHGMIFRDSNFRYGGRGRRVCR